MSSMAHTPVKPAAEAAPVTATVVVSDGGIVDHPFTPWKVVPKRCNTCGKVARRHAVVEVAGGPPVSTDSPAEASQVANQPPATTTAAPAADAKKAREARATARLSKLATGKAGGR